MELIYTQADNSAQWYVWEFIEDTYKICQVFYSEDKCLKYIKDKK